LVDVKNEELIANFHKYGYNKVDSAIFRSIKKKAKPENALCFNFNGLWYVSIPTNYKPLEYIDFHNTILDPRESIHTWNPEDIILLSESTKKWDRVYKKYKKIPRNQKVDMIRSFIDNNKDSPLFKEELRTAEKILARMGE
jgi:hypothetical protein